MDTSQRIRTCVNRAMMLLESDREAARRWLNDATALLGPEAQDPAMSPPPAFRPGGLTAWQARQALERIEAALGSRMDARELADLVGCSKSHFFRAFRESFGLPPMTYVATRRVERAKLMMTSTREQLSDIALACGFADQSHLNRSFRRIVGVSPGLWRRMHSQTASPNLRRAAVRGDEPATTAG